MSPSTAIRVDEGYIRQLPKAEVHVHLEGSFELADLLELARESGVALPGPAATLFDVDTHYAPSAGAGAGTGVGAAGLSGFLRFLDWECGLIRTRAQAARTAYRFAARQSASGIRYTDVIVNPTHWSGWSGTVESLLAALAAGFDEAEQDGLCTVQISYSLLRTQGAVEAEEIVSWITRRRPSRVVALSVDGNESESGRTGEKFAPAFTLARNAGLRRTVHAGESSGPEGVWDALTLLHAERIDHGVRSIDDPALLDYLRDHAIPLNVCPRSNITLGVYPTMERHPLPALRAHGVIVTVNTDDPAPIGTRLENEWSLCAESYGWGTPDMIDLARASIEASFATDELKRDLVGELATFG